jgi:hypothetical protein
MAAAGIGSKSLLLIERMGLGAEQYRPSLAVPSGTLEDVAGLREGEEP